MMEEVPVKTGKTVTLHDVAFGLLFIYILGVPFGVIIDYLWNRIVLYITLDRLVKPAVSMRALKRTWVYAIFITLIGLLIDWGYYVIIWDSGWEPAMSLASQLALIIPVILLLLAANAVLCIKYLKLERRQTIVTSSVMAVLTAPWILPIVPHAAGWVE
jgi:hypothetical protein